jgi:hypothetical protein
MLTERRRVGGGHRRRWLQSMTPVEAWGGRSGAVQARGGKFGAVEARGDSFGVARLGHVQHER